MVVYHMQVMVMLMLLFYLFLFFYFLRILWYPLSFLLSLLQFINNIFFLYDYGLLSLLLGNLSMYLDIFFIVLVFGMIDLMKIN